MMKYLLLSMALLAMPVYAQDKGAAEKDLPPAPPAAPYLTDAQIKELEEKGELVVDTKTGETVEGKTPRPWETPLSSYPAATTRWRLNVAERSPAYELVHVEVETPSEAIHFDVFVMSVVNGAPRFTTAVKVAEDDPEVDEFVFTGPPGRYAIRVTSYDQARGFVVATRNMEIVGASGPGPIDPGTPEDPGNPPQPPVAGDKPPPEGVYGFGPVVYENVLKVSGGASGAVKLRDNYEWAARSDLPLDQIFTELDKRNVQAFVPEPNWRAYREAVKAHADRLVQNRILPADSKEDWRIAWNEIVSGLSAALGDR